MEHTKWQWLSQQLENPRWMQELPDYVCNEVQDIRFRRGRVVSLVCGGKTYFPDRRGGVRLVPDENTVVLTPQETDDLLYHLCGGSVYAHEDELRRGWISLPGGFRAGVCGTAATENGRILSVEDVSSVVIRVPRDLPGCSRDLLCRLGMAAYRGFLLAGAPSSGKTTLLRDLVRTIGTALENPLRVAVLDERNEFAALREERACTAEILTGYPKADGILQALRYLAPDVILCDEIAEEAEAAALLQAAGAGTAVIASIHASSKAELRRRPLWPRLAKSGLFSAVAYLRGSVQPGTVDNVEFLEEADENVRCPADFCSCGPVRAGTGEPA